MMTLKEKIEEALTHHAECAVHNPPAPTQGSAVHILSCIKSDPRLQALEAVAEAAKEYVSVMSEHGGAVSNKLVHALTKLQEQEDG